MPKTGDDGSQQRADRRQRNTHAEDRLDLFPAGCEAALEEDQRQRHNADGLRHVETDEFDDAEALRADDDAEDQEEHQTRNARAAGDERGRDGERKQNTGDQD